MTVTMLLVVGFVVAALGELYFFLLQRSALMVCRASLLPPELRFFLLPLYYRAGWLFIAGKWAAALALAVHGRWALAVLLVIASFVLAGIAPIPHSRFFPIYRRALQANARGAPPEVVDALRSALDEAVRRYDA